MSAEQQQQGPPQFHANRPAGKADTAIPATEREADTDEEDASMAIRALRTLRTLAGKVDVRTAGTWVLIGFAVAWVTWTGGAHWTHQQWGWGPCPHRQQIDMMYRLAAPPSQPGGAPTITLPPPRDGGGE